MWRRSLCLGYNSVLIRQVFTIFLHQNVRDIAENLLSDAIMKTSHNGKHDN